MYHDEELLRAKKLAKQEENNLKNSAETDTENTESIYDEVVHYNNRELTFSRRHIEELGFSMIMPDELFLLDENTMKLMFPGGKTPICAYSSNQSLMNISFNRTAEKVPESNIKNYLELNKRILETVGPNVKITRTYEKNVGETHFGILEFYSKALDGTLYNIMVIQSTVEGLVVIAFNIQSNQVTRLKPLIIEMLESYQMSDEGEMER
jgi:hypothetical protein